MGTKKSFDLSFGESSLKDDIRMKIEIQYKAINQAMIFFEEYISDEIQKNKKNLNSKLENAKDENEENSCFYSNNAIENEIFNIKNKFYHAMFLLAFSYYDSIFALINKKDCHEKFDNMRNIRNYLTHNYNIDNTSEIEKQINSLNDETNKKIGLTYYADGGGCCIEKEYVEYALNTFYDKLIELYNKNKQKTCNTSL